MRVNTTEQTPKATIITNHTSTPTDLRKPGYNSIYDSLYQYDMGKVDFDDERSAKQRHATCSIFL